MPDTLPGGCQAPAEVTPGVSPSGDRVGRGGGNAWGSPVEAAGSASHESSTAEMTRWNGGTYAGVPEDCDPSMFCGREREGGGGEHVRAAPRLLGCLHLGGGVG